MFFQDDVLTIKGEMDKIHIIGPRCTLFMGDHSIPLYPKILKLEGSCKKMIFEQPSTRTCSANERGFIIFLDPDYVLPLLPLLPTRLSSSSPPDRFDETKYDLFNEVPVTSTMLETHLTCSICREEFGVRDRCIWLPCTHVYHGRCIRPWMAQSDLCPLCKTNVISRDRVIPLLA